MSLNTSFSFGMAFEVGYILDLDLDVDKTWRQ